MVEDVRKQEECICGHEHAHEEHYEHTEICGCEHEHHEHTENCDCGQEHAHEEHHHISGHPNNCHCELCHTHEEYCDVCGESLGNCICNMPDANNPKKVYLLKNLGCANCAAKMEYKIKELPGVKYASVSFVTKQLRLSAINQDIILPEIQKICQDIESDVEVVPRDGNGPFSFETKTYILENLGCANCAAKMERAINDLPGVSMAQITFATKQLKLTAKDHKNTLEQVKNICNKIEEGVVVTERTTKPVLAENINKRKRSGGLLSVNEDQRSLIEIIVGGILFILTEWVGVVPEEYHLYVLALAYVILGARIVWTALKNVFSGNALDENFLMTVATLGAFVIKAYEEAVGVIFFYRLGEYFEHRAVEKSRRQIMTTVDMRPEVVNLVVGEEVKVLPSANANVGDILLVRVGDRIPLDGVVIEGESLIDTSPVTGEPVPMKKKFGDEVISGCMNTSEMLKIRVEKVLEESMVTKILDSVENAAASKPHIDKFITRFARIYTPTVVVLAILTAIGRGLFYGDWQDAIYTALTFLVISCPCALVLSVPLAFFSGIGAGSKLGILFKGGVVLEALKNVSIIIMDKTGTVTKGNFVVQEIRPNQGISENELLKICASSELVSTHPIAASLVVCAKEMNLNLVRPQSFKEISGEGLITIGPEGKILCGNIKLMKSYNVDISNYTLADYGTEVLIAKDGKFIGQIIIDDTIKDDAISSIKALKSLGLSTALLTGDKKTGAELVAKKIGVDEVSAELLPQDKLTELNVLRNRYGSAMFVGDGINDAPVLAGADVGAAMGTGADASIEAADVVFMNSEMEAIPKAIAIAKRTGTIAWQNVWFALFVKAIIMVAGFFGYASMWAAVFADTGVSVLCVLNSVRILYGKY